MMAKGCCFQGCFSEFSVIWNVGFGAVHMRYCKTLADHDTNNLFYIGVRIFTAESEAALHNVSYLEEEK